MTKKKIYNFFSKIGRVGLVILALSILLIVVYLGRGIWRGTVMRIYVQKVYGPGISRHFDQDFSAVNNQLKGFSFPHFAANPIDCTDITYTGFGETIYCDRHQDSSVNMTPQLLDHWMTAAPGLEKYLLTNGWQRTNNPGEPSNNRELQQLVTVTNDFVNAEYIKPHGKTTCNLSIGYNSDVNTRILSANEYCARDVKFFGGANY